MRRIAKWSLGSLALAGAVALGAWLLAPRSAEAHTAELAVVYSGKVLYRFYSLDVDEEREKGALPCTLILLQDTTSIGGSLLVQTPEGDLQFDVAGQVGHDRLFLVATTGTGTLVLGGKVGGKTGRRTVKASGHLVDNLELNEIKLSVKEIPQPL